MNKLENIFIGFRNHSFEELIKYHQSGNVSDKEKLLLRSIYENASNEITEFIKESKADKSIDENDFDWSMKLYVFVSVQEFFDIFDRIEKADDPHVKALQSIDKQELLKKLKKIFGGADIDFYTDKAYGVIEESNKGAKTYEEFIVGRTYIIFQMFKENKVNMDIKELSKEKIASMAEKNYQDSIVNFVKNCI